MKNIKQLARKYAPLATATVLAIYTILGCATQGKESAQKNYESRLSQEALERKIKVDFITQLPEYDATAHWLSGSGYEDFMIQYSDSVLNHK
ncbi:MAG TPA: hypothetical protein VJJ23_02820 [Candidatus Nanoarchaeia archaeon]|nr:hypothetical protein [Candidatus Nanoarchaeia archaeon]